jgi:hypothetical protein
MSTISLVPSVWILIDFILLVFWIFDLFHHLTFESNLQRPNFVILIFKRNWNFCISLESLRFYSRALPFHYPPNRRLNWIFLVRPIKITTIKIRFFYFICCAGVATLFNLKSVKTRNHFDYWLNCFPFFHPLILKITTRNFVTQVHNLSGDTTAKTFLTNFLPLNELGANEFTSQSCLTRIL